MGHSVPRGFRAAGVHCGIKGNPNRLDLTLIVGDEPFVAAGVYTQNRIFAAPVAVDRARTPSDQMRVLVANSGNANACTGQRGEQDALEMTRLAASACGANPDQALVLSTGIIGEYLPMDKIAQGIEAACAQLGDGETAFLQAARGILTTDRQEKVAARIVQLPDRQVSVFGMAKGAGMIGPNMATMLGVILTDAPLAPDVAQQVLQYAVNFSFNCISVEGHMSTNDTVFLLASGKAGGEALAGAELGTFADAVRDVSVELARMIPDDGEGASHLITIDVNGCATTLDAQQIARTVANSALVKTAIAGADPNWGRIISAVGYAGVPFNPLGIRLRVNQTLLYEQGTPTQFDAAATSASIRGNRETHIELMLSEGDARTRFWTSDLTVDYVKLNADYHT